MYDNTLYIHVLTDGGSDSYNMLVPHSGCSPENGELLCSKFVIHDHVFLPIS